MIFKKLVVLIGGITLSSLVLAQAAAPVQGQQPQVQPQGAPAGQPASPPPGVYPGYTPGAPASNPAMAGAYSAPAPAVGSPMTVAAPQQPPGSLPPLPSDFDLAVQSTLAMTPGQIVELRRLLDARQRAAAQLPNPPRSVTGTVSVSMSPGAAPPVIRPFIGATTSFTVVDATGAPWPVDNFRIGNANSFQVNRLDGAGGSVFTVDTMETYGQTNLVMKLAGAPTPIVINVLAGQKVHDARVEVRVQGRGPNSVVTQAAPLVRGTDARLLSVLDGMAPEGGKSLSVSGAGDTRAWMMPNGRMMVRTPLVIVSPASIGGGTSFVSSADGTHVYEFMPTPNILAMVDNQFVNLTIQGW